MSRKSAPTWRVFCAIELPSFVRQQISTHVERLRELAPDAHASWSRAENIHLTLKFVGELPVPRVEQLSLAASAAVAGWSAFEIGIGNAGTFPKNNNPRVLWIGVDDPSGKLMALETKLEQECARVGFEKEARAFHPHLTIARIRRPEGARALAAAHREQQFESLTVNVTELLVIRSELSSAGSKYTTVTRHSLARQ